MLGLTPHVDQPNNTLVHTARPASGTGWPPSLAQAGPTPTFEHSLASSLAQAHGMGPDERNPFAQPNHTPLSQFLANSRPPQISRMDRKTFSDRMADTAHRQSGSAQESPHRTEIFQEDTSLSSEMKKNISRQNLADTTPRPAPDRQDTTAPERPELAGPSDQAQQHAQPQDTGETNRLPAGNAVRNEQNGSPAPQADRDQSQETASPDASVPSGQQQSPSTIQTQGAGALPSAGSDIRSAGNSGTNTRGGQSQTGNTGLNQNTVVTAARAAPTSLGRSFLDHFTTTRNSGQASPQGQSAGNTAQTNTQMTGTEDARQAAFRPQVIRGMLSSIHHGGGSVTMKLQPESLGALRVQMTMTSKGQVSVQFHTATPEARRLLTQSLDSLKAAIEQHGLKMEQVTIQPLTRAPQGSESQTNQDLNTGNRNAHRQTNTHHDAGGHESRGFRDTPEHQEGKHAAAPRSQPAQEARQSGTLHQDT